MKRRSFLKTTGLVVGVTPLWGTRYAEGLQDPHSAARLASKKNPRRHHLKRFC